MKSLKWLLLAVAVIVGLAAAAAYKSKLQKSEMEPLPPPEAPTTTTSVELQTAEPAPTPEVTTSAPQAAPQQTEPPPKANSLPMVTVRPDTVLATVNGTALALGDLMAINPAVVTQKSIRADAYSHLLDLAIERELTFQTAKARGVELDDLQKQNLEEIRAAALSRAHAPYMPADYDAEAQAAFEVRVGTVQMLQNTLLGEAGPPAQYVTPAQVQEYYEAHQSEFDPLPRNAAAREKAWLPIETGIRNQLISKVYIQHEKNRRQLLEELRAAATIEQLVGATGD
jgi:hypothetical protein